MYLAATAFWRKIITYFANAPPKGFRENLQHLNSISCRLSMLQASSAKIKFVSWRNPKYNLFYVIFFNFLLCREFLQLFLENAVAIKWARHEHKLFCGDARVAFSQTRFSNRWNVSRSALQATKKTLKSKKLCRISWVSMPTNQFFRQCTPKREINTLTQLSSVIHFSRCFPSHTPAGSLFKRILKHKEFTWR